MPRPLSACAAPDRGRRVRRPWEGSFFVCRGEACLALSPHSRLLVEGGGCVAPSDIPSSCVGAGDCLALSPHARLLIEGDACVAPTKVPSSCVGARHASPSLRMRGC